MFTSQPRAYRESIDASNFDKQNFATIFHADALFILASAARLFQSLSFAILPLSMPELISPLLCQPWPTIARR